MPTHTPEMKELVTKRLKQLPGPHGDPSNQPYMVEFINNCDACAMYSQDGALMWAWSQDEMNAWYWHVDLEYQSDQPMLSSLSYHYCQDDGSKVEVPAESTMVKQFMENPSKPLFFNGFKYFGATKEICEDNCTYVLMANPERSVQCYISPTREYMVIVAASPKALPTEHYFGIESGRAPGKIVVNAHSLAAHFKKHAPQALGLW